MVLFLRELARNRKSFIIWAVCLVLSNIGMLSLYPTFADQAKTYSDMIKQMPEAMVGGLGMDKLDFANIIHYFAYIFLYIILFAGVYSMLLGSGIVSKEEDDKTIEFLYSKPITRTSIVTAKSMCVLFYITLLNTLIIAADFITFELIKREDYSISSFILIHAGAYLMQLTFAAIGIFLSMFVVKAKSVFPISIGIIIGTFFLSFASGVSEKLETLKYLSPFKYVSPADLAIEGRIQTAYIVIMVIVMYALMVSTYIIYNRKNISV